MGFYELYNRSISSDTELSHGETSAYELYHHGVKGQKWGVRRQQKRAASKKARAKVAKERIKKSGNGLYIFEAYSPEYDKMPEPKKAMDPWYYVDKKTGETGYYYPFRFKNPRKFFEMESVPI